MEVVTKTPVLQQSAFSFLEATIDIPDEPDVVVREETPIDAENTCKKGEKNHLVSKTGEVTRPNPPGKTRTRGPDMRKHKNVVERMATMPEVYSANYRRAMGGRSPAAGIKAFCLECVGWQREEVKLCASQACPLFAYRPYHDAAEQQ